MVFTGDDAKKKWKALRENYRKEHAKKRTTTGQAAGDNWKSKWRYFDDLSFLHNQFTPRVTSGSMGHGQIPQEDSQNTGEAEDRNECVDEEELEEHADGISDNFNAPEASGNLRAKYSDTPTQSRKRQAASDQENGSSTVQKHSKTFKQNLLQKMVNLEERKVAQYEKRNQTQPQTDDADYHFLMSLLPSFLVSNSPPEKTAY